MVESGICRDGYLCGPLYMFSAEWKTSHSWHSCKKCATLTGGLRVIRSDTVQISGNLHRLLPCGLEL